MTSVDTSLGTSSEVLAGIAIETSLGIVVGTETPPVVGIAMGEAVVKAASRKSARILKSWGGVILMVVSRLLCVRQGRAGWVNKEDRSRR